VRFSKHHAALAATAALTLVAAPAAGSAAAPRLPTFWTSCSMNVKESVVEIWPVEVLHLTCAQAEHTIKSAHVLLTPGGPLFSASGFACRSAGILPRVDPSPIQLPAKESCSDHSQRKLSFIWNYSN